MFPCDYLPSKLILFRNFTNEDRKDLTWLAIFHQAELWNIVNWDGSFYKCSFLLWGWTQWEVAGFEVTFSLNHQFSQSLCRQHHSYFKGQLRCRTEVYKFYLRCAPPSFRMLCTLSYPPRSQIVWTSLLRYFLLAKPTMHHNFHELYHLIACGV